MSLNTDLFISKAEVNGVAGRDVLIRGGCIAAIGTGLQVPAGVESVDAAGGVLLPGLRDHHLHLAASAVAHGSLPCGPDDWAGADALGAALQLRAQANPGQWLRGIGYHESLAGDIDAAWLDRWAGETPVRIQHRGGRQWVFNTAALYWLQVSEGDPLERENGELTGRLIEGDAWLRRRMAELGRGGFPDLQGLSRELAGYGITGVTDTSPDNNPQTLQHFQQARRNGDLLQDLLLMGDASLDGVQSMVEGVVIGAHKFHLLESDLPDLDQLINAICDSHAAGRNVAFHCVTRTELVFALTALDEAGVRKGDRIEHASVTPPEQLALIRNLGLIVVTQPALVAERGDQYLTDVEADDQPWLYRLNAFLRADVPLAGSSDAPYTALNPWLGMQAAVTRRTRNGARIGEHEALTPEQALALYTSPLLEPGRTHIHLREGGPADCCLLAQPWPELRGDMASAEVVLTLRGGEPIMRADSR